MKVLNSIDKYFICYILVFIALLQLYNSQFGVLDPWKGGGFGMFSTNKNTNITAVGFTKDGDSILINIVGSKFDVPISKNFLLSTKNYPKKEKLKRLGRQIMHSYLKPTHIEYPLNIDEHTLDEINENHKFYEFVYIPTHFENDTTALREKAVKIDRIKIRLFQTDFFENDLSVKKFFLGELEIRN